MGFSFFLVNQKYCIIKLYNYNKKNIKIIDMKTKNILKIGIFSIVLFALLISPVLKSNAPQVRAISECEKDENNGICINKGLKCTTLGEYKESSFKCANYKEDKCCISDPDAGTTQVGQHGLHTVKVPLKEERADDVCKISFDEAKTKCSNDQDGLFFEKQECKMQAFFTYQWCQIVKGVVEGLGKMFSGLINLEIEWILNALNPKAYGGFATNVGVIAIWTMLRNIVNSLLVLGLIGIAIATILGYKKYAWKQILWKLILVALLVNFSLVISGIIVDTSNYLTIYFLNMSQENGSTAPRIMESFGYTASTTPDTYDPPSIFGDDKYKTPAIVGAEEPDEVESYTLRFGNFFIISFVMILVGGFSVIALLSIFLTVIIRNLLLIILLGLSPIVFAAWIFPDTEKYWKMWWDNFLKWCSFPIIFAFSLYIGLTAMTAINTIAPIGTTDSMAITIIRMVLFSMFLVGGLIFSIQGGGAISQAIIKQTSKIGAATGAFISKKTTGTVKESSTYKKAGELLTKVPLLGGVGQEMMVAGEKAKAGRVKEHEKNLENVGLGSLKELEKAPAPSPLDRNAYERRIALTNKLADIGELSKESVEFIKMHQGDTRLDASAITKAIPHYFKLEEGQLVKTGKPIKSKVEALGRIKSDKMKEKTQSSDFIKNIVDDRKDRASAVAMSRGKTKEEAEEFANRTADSTFDKTIQEIINTLSPAQMAAFWHSLSPKDLIKKGWGGPDGKIMKAIEKDDATKKKFEQHLNDSKPLRAESGIDPQVFHPDTDSPDTDPDELERIENIFK